MSMDQPCHAFGDESKRGGTYRLAVAHVGVADLAETRRLLRAELLRGQRSIHFADERDARRRRLLVLFGQMTNRVDHYSSRLSDHPSAEHARAHLLRLLAVDLVKSGVTRLVLESRDDRDTHDQSVLRAVLGAHPPLVYEHIASTRSHCYGLPTDLHGQRAKAGIWAERARPTFLG